MDLHFFASLELDLPVLPSLLLSCTSHVILNELAVIGLLNLLLHGVLSLLNVYSILCDTTHASSRHSNLLGVKLDVSWVSKRSWDDRLDIIANDTHHLRTSSSLSKLVLRHIKATHQVCSHSLPLTALSSTTLRCVQSFVYLLVRYLTDDYTRRLLVYSQLS